MPAGPRDNQYSTLPPPGFTDSSVALKRGQIIELLEKVIDKYQNEPQFLVQQSKQTDLLVSIAQFTLLSTPISSNDKRDFLNNIVMVAQGLLTDENNNEIASSVDSSPQSNENNATTLTIPPSDTTNNDGDFSLDDLANEYLQNEPTPSSLNDKPTTSSESEEPDLTRDNLSKTDLSSSPSTPSPSVLSTLVFPLLSNEPAIIKPPLESILFSNRLSSNDAADDADCIWKEESSLFGQIFCMKTNEIPIIATKRISTCLFDRSLYERLSRLINLLPKQCIRNSVQQLSIRHNDQQSHRPPRPNNDNRRSTHRPSFQQNSLQSHPMPRYPLTQNPRHYSNANYSNQQGNFNGYFVDRRPPQQQQQQQNRYASPSFASYPPDQQQQQNRYASPSFASYPPDQQHQQKGPPKNNSYNNVHQQQKKKPQTNNQPASNQYQQQRSTKKGSGGGGGNKLTNEKPGAPGPDPNLNSK